MIQSNRKQSEPALEDENWQRERLDAAWKADQPDDMPVYQKRRSAGLWTAIAVLTVALGAVSFYGYSVLKANSMQLAQMPGITRSLEAVGLRIIGMEGQIGAVRKDQQGLAEQTKQLDTKYAAGLDEARSYARTVAAGMSARLKREMGAQNKTMQASLSQNEADHKADQVRLAQMEEQLSEAKQELAAVKQQYAAQLAAVQNQQAVNQNRIQSISSMLATDQVSFQAIKGQDQEIIPGVVLHVSNIDTHRQRFDGWVSLTGSKSSIRFRNQNAQQPVVFYTSPDGQAYQLVVTTLGQNGASGYLFVPGGNGNQRMVMANGDQTSGASAAEPSF